MGKVIERKDIPIKELFIDGMNVRQNVGLFAELEDSIEDCGMLEPVIVRQNEPGKYGIVVGSRRFLAAKGAGLKLIPAIVMDLSDEDAMLYSFTENSMRSDLSIEELAEVVAKFYIIDKSERKVAKRLGITRTSVHDALCVKGIKKVQDEAKKDDGRRATTSAKVLKEVAKAASSLFGEEVEKVPDKASELCNELKGESRDEAKGILKEMKALKESGTSIDNIPEVVQKIKKERSERISFKVSFDNRVSNAFNRAVQERHISRSEVIDTAIRQWLRTEGYLQ